MKLPPAGRPEKLLYLAFASLGVVYGDIGTSPVYTLHAAVGDQPDAVHVLAACSLIVWYLFAIVTVKYVHFLMQLNNHGEGGIFALVGLAQQYVPKQTWLMYVLILGASLLYGDGIITPAISVLSAVEGLAPAGYWSNSWGAAAILFVLFAAQRFGTRTVSNAFAPIMTVWFITIALLGIPEIFKDFSILKALNPLTGFGFLWWHPAQAMTVLAGITLACTGAEALYADLGHFSRHSIGRAWNWFVAPALMLNYLGQGAHLLHSPNDSSSIFFIMAPVWGRFPLTLLSIAATVIASQALISGVFSLTHQATNLGYFPRTRVVFTNAEHSGQIYLPGLNWLLAFGSISLVLAFKRSDALADAYGFAVTGTMVATTIAYACIEQGKTKRFPWIAVPLLLLDLSLFIPNSSKFTTGGYIPVGIGLAFTVILFAWHNTRQTIRRRLSHQTLTLAEFGVTTQNAPRTRNTAVFLSATKNVAPISLLHWLKIAGAMHHNVVVLTIVTESQPRVPSHCRLCCERYENNIFGIEVHYGFMDKRDISAIEHEIRLLIDSHNETIVYIVGQEYLICKTTSFLARIYRALTVFNQPTPEAFHLPSNKVVQIATPIEL